jgi:hypothetical protein
LLTPHPPPHKHTCIYIYIVWVCVFPYIDLPDDDFVEAKIFFKSGKENNNNI